MYPNVQTIVIRKHSSLYFTEDKQCQQQQQRN